MTSLTQLAEIISAESAKISDYIVSNDLPRPSFDVGAPPALPIPIENRGLQESQLRLLRAAQDLAALALGPVEDLRWRAWNQYNDNVSLHAIMSYRIAEAVPLPGSITFAELSKKTGVPEALVTRLIRHAITYNCFREPSPGQVEHTASSVALHNGGTVRDWLDMTFEEWGPASVKAVEALRRFPDSEEQNEGAFALAFDRQTMFEYLAKRPERAKVFGSAMGNFSKGASHKVEYLVESYDWQGLGDSTVVDLGGSHGHASIAIAKAAPKLKFVVEDLPGTAADGERMLDARFKDRIQFLGHNLMNEQPVKDADVYMFRSVLLNWPDKYVVQFLKNLVPALKRGAKVLVNEGCLPEPGELSSWDDKLLRSLDLCMMSMFNSKERTVEEWAGLFGKADGRFRFMGAKKREGSLLWIIEAVWEP